VSCLSSSISFCVCLLYLILYPIIIYFYVREMINQNLGYSDRAERTMDIYTAAVLVEKLTERVTPPESWKEMMNTLSDISCERYVFGIC
jgi:Phosphoenolpyruvate carboxylase